MTPERAHFVREWEVGEGNGGGRFFITLDADGTERKTLGSPHGSWTLVDGGARISWEDAGMTRSARWEPGTRNAPSNPARPSTINPPT